MYRIVFLVILNMVSLTYAKTYEVGPDRASTSIGTVPWEHLAPGDTVAIHWRAEPYREKWVICRQGTADQPIVVRGVPGPNGELPVIDGRNATTRAQLNFWNEPRGVIKIGGANVPVDTIPQYIVLENLDIRSGRPPYAFTGRDGKTAYAKNCAAVFVEKGEHIIIRNCVLRDCGNGFFCASGGKDILVEACHIYDNGMEGRIYEHNNYTEAHGIVFQFNHFGPLRTGCLGNNLKDRSAGTVIRYNWIEDGNRQLDLVDSGHAELIDDPAYRSTFVYGNVLVEGDGEGNRQIVHYGGDSGDLDRYRKGTLYFYNNTVISTRLDRTTLFRLSSGDEMCEMWNNIVYTIQPGSHLSLSNRDGVIKMGHNWLKAGWVSSFDALGGAVEDLGGNITGENPGFVNAAAQRFDLLVSSVCVDSGRDLVSGAALHPAVKMYVKHRGQMARSVDGRMDLGAYERVSADFDDSGAVDFADFVLFASAFGKMREHDAWDAHYDLDGDGSVGVGDFLIFAHVFGSRAVA